MMFAWKEDMVRFMTDASEHSDFHALLTKEIVQQLGPGGHICDAGCGLGYLSRAMSPYFDKITAVDINSDAIAGLRTRIAAGEYPNITPICGDIHKCLPETPYDKMVFCLFGQLSEIFSIAKQQCRGKLVIIKKNWPCHTFSLTHPPRKGRSLIDVCDILQRLGIDHSAGTCAIELGQPLRSEADAVRFFRLYSHDPDPEAIEFEHILPLLQTGPSEEFPYYLPARKKLGILTLDARQIPDAFPPEMETIL
ncbi:MAG: class I SAM-dependent methyltransferase [Ruminococcaceae bacterium]|nr:class I SAM-dependent methyltransferase [Oscillospiraceae bacterium]